MPYEFNPFTEEFDFYLYEPTEYVAKKETIGSGSLVWTSHTDMPTARRLPAAAADSNGNVYVAGSYTYKNKFEIYDAASETWSTGTDVPTGVYGAMGVCDSSGNFHLIGGNDGSGVKNLHQVWNGSSWTTSGSLNTARRDGAVAIDNNDNIYISHGEGSSGHIALAEKWSPSTSAFSTLSSASAARKYTAGDILDGVFYVICGYDGSQKRNIEAYNLSSGTWSDVTPSSGAPTARHGIIAVTLDDDKIHILYGYDGSSFRDLHETWDGTTCVELTASATSPARAYMGIGGQTQESVKKAYVVGGHDNSSDIADCDILAVSASVTVECYPVEEKC